MQRLRPLLRGDDDERREIERQLHDGVQQRLVALSVHVQLARGLVETDPSAATRALDNLRSEIGEAIDELRGVAQRLYPPLLETQGLVVALEMAGTAAAIPAHVVGSLPVTLPLQVSLTVYRIWQLALATAGGGTDPSAAIAVSLSEGVLAFEVTRAGVGSDRHAWETLAARVELLDGALEVEAARIAGRLPVSS